MSVPTSRWLTSEFLLRCMYSIGSSIVTMCCRVSALILSMIAASVVVFPLPVGPVTSTSPRALVMRSPTTGGSPSSSSARILNGIARNVPATAPRWRKMFARKRARPFTPNDRSISQLRSKRARCSSVRIW